MAKTIQFKRGTTAQTNLFVGALGEVTVDTDKDVVVVHNGTTQGGFAQAARANVDGTVSIINRAGSVLGTATADGTLTPVKVKTSSAGTKTSPAVQIGADNTGFYAISPTLQALSIQGQDVLLCNQNGLATSIGGTVYDAFMCRAWINFNGSGVPTTRGSGNISSIVDNGVGNWTVNLAAAMPDVNFAIAATGGRYNSGNLVAVQGPNCTALSTSSIQIVAGSDTSAVNDWLDVYMTIFR